MVYFFVLCQIGCRDMKNICSHEYSLKYLDIMEIIEKKNSMNNIVFFNADIQIFMSKIDEMQIFSNLPVFVILLLCVGVVDWTIIGTHS
jgi:hypothetical protein